VAAEVAGSVGLAPSANIGENVAMFEAIHGSAPGLPADVANPSGLLLSGVMMLVHLGQTAAAQAVHNAWLRTIEDGIHPADIFVEGQSTRLVGTAEFADEVIRRLGKLPIQLPTVQYDKPVDLSRALARVSRAKPADKQLVGVDIFVSWVKSANELAAILQQSDQADLPLQMITNRGVKVWPGGFPETFCTDHWRCRFMKDNGTIVHGQVVRLLDSLERLGVDFIKMENLCTFDGEPGYSLGQGQ
jgi:isocitrate dehydrogenase